MGRGILIRKKSIYIAKIEDPTRSMNEDQFESMMKVSSRMTGRKARGKFAKAYILYPDDKLKSVWEFVTTK